MEPSNKQIPQALLEQQLNSQLTSEDLKSFQPNITVYAYRIINLQLSEFRNYTIQQNSLNIFRYEPIYYTKVKQDEEMVDCNWFSAYRAIENINVVPIDDGNQNVSLNNIIKTSIYVNDEKFLNAFNSQDLILFTLNRPITDFRIEEAVSVYLITDLSYIGNVEKKNTAHFNLTSVNNLKIAKNSRIVFIANKTNDYSKYQLNGLIITKPLETIIDTVQVIGYREGLAEEYQIPLSIEENVFTYCKFQVADESEIISLYFDWLDAFKTLTFFYFKDNTENLNLFSTVFSESFSKNFQRAFLFTLCFSYIYNDGFSQISNDFNESKKITTVDDYFYTLLNNAKNDVASVCDNWISNVIFQIPYTKDTNDFMKYKSVIPMLNEFLYSKMCFNDGFNEIQRLFLPYYFLINTQIDRDFIKQTLNFDPQKTGTQLTINLTPIFVSLRSTFFRFIKDEILEENILIPYWTDISDKPLVGYIPIKYRQGWNEIKGKYLTIDKELKKQNYLKSISDYKELDAELLKYMGIIFFDSKDDLNRFWKYRNDNETDTRILPFEYDFKEDKSKDIPALLEQTKELLIKQGITNFKSIEIYGTPAFVPSYIKYTITGWVYFIRDLLLPAYLEKGISSKSIGNDFIYYKDTEFQAGDILNGYGYILKIENNQALIVCLSIELLGALYTYIGSNLLVIEDRFWNLKGSNFWREFLFKDKGNKDNWVDKDNPYKWWIRFFANIRVVRPGGPLLEARIQITMKYLNIFKEGDKYKIYMDNNSDHNRLVFAALFPKLITDWNALITFETTGANITDFNVIYNRQNWLSYFFQLNPGYITGKKTIDLKILFKESKNFQLKNIKTIRIKGIWGGDFGLKIRYIDDKGTEYIDDLKNDRIKESFVLFDNNDEKITETNINFV